MSRGHRHVNNPMVLAFWVEMCPRLGASQHTHHNRSLEGRHTVPQEGQRQRASGKKKERVGNLQGGQEGFLCGSRQPGLGPAPPPAAGADLWRPRERSELERVSLIN